jgi:hypothetical protein
MKPGDRNRARPVMPDSLRRHHFGPLQPMARPSLLERLIQLVRRQA